MDPKLRVVQMRLTELWDEDGPIAATRGSDLDVEGVRNALRLGARAAAVANVGDPLRWLCGRELFDWWKTEAAPRLLDPREQRWYLEDLPGERGWLASEWRCPDGQLLLAFESMHELSRPPLRGRLSEPQRTAHASPAQRTVAT